MKVLDPKTGLAVLGDERLSDDNVHGAIRRKFSFLVSFWFEPGGAEAPAGGGWRGSVEHLGSGRRLYFNQIASLVGFLSGWLGRRDAEGVDG